MALTLVPEALARIGARFTYRGPNAGAEGTAVGNDGSECTDCPFQRLCFGLEPGLPYEVTAVRDVRHPCALHDGGRVRVVEARAASFTTSLGTRHLRGTAAPWDPVPCGYPECPKNALCHPAGIAPGRRHAIEADEGIIDCPMGHAIHCVRLRPL